MADESTPITGTRLREVLTGQGLVSCMYRHGREQRSVSFDTNDDALHALPYVVPHVFSDGSFVLEDHAGNVLKSFHAPGAA